MLYSSRTVIQYIKQNKLLFKEKIYDECAAAIDLRQKSADIFSLLERQMQEMRADKTDRSALAAMFTEMAMRLNDEWQFPSPDVERVP